MLLFGSFLAWRCSIASPSRSAATSEPQNIILHARRWRRARVGTLAYVAMLYLHPVLIGVPVIAIEVG